MLRIKQSIKRTLSEWPLYWIILAFLVLLLCALIYCDGFTDGSLISEGFEQLPNSLDPSGPLTVEAVKINNSLFESLVELDKDHQRIKPCLAEKWIVSENQQNYTFTLKKGILFHDFSRVDAKAVTYSFLRQIERNQDSPLFSMIDTVESIDSLSLIIKLKYPYAPFLYALCSPLGLKAVSFQALQAYGEEIGHHPVGSGPFKLSRWKRNKEITLSPFKHYRQSVGNINQISFELYNNSTRLDDIFQGGKLDIIFLVPGYYIDRLKWLGVVDYQVAPPTSTIFIGFNNKTPPFNIREVRLAVSYALNLEKMVSGIFRGNSVAARGPLPPVLFDYEEAAPHIYNLEKSRQLMKRAGYPEGFTAKFYYLDRFRARNTIFEAIRHDLDNVGIHVQMIPFYSWEEEISASQSDSSQMFWIGWGSDMLGDAGNFLYSLFYSRSPYNIFHYENDQVDRWLEESRREPDLDKRQDLYRRIIDRIREDVPLISMYHVIQIYAYNRHKIRDLPLDPYGNIDYQNIVLTDKQEN